MLYREASRILDHVQEKKGSAKNLVLNSKYKNKKQLFALVCETLKYKTILVKILESTKLQKHEKILKSESLAQVLVYDFLLGKGLVQTNVRLKDAILKHKSALQSELARLKVKTGSQQNEDLLSETVRNEIVLPRYIRVNTLKTTVNDVMNHFKKEGFSQLHTTASSYTGYTDIVKSLKKKQFLQDIHIPDLLVFAAGTDLHDHILYKSGEIIFQDKASCIPAYVLAPPPGSKVMDCCAAPGNKTSQLAAIMQNSGTLHAFDKDMRRMATMRTMLLRAGVLCASCENLDFLRCDPESSKYKDVEYILVDPSCSGSGIVNRLNEVTDDSVSRSSGRLDGLARFQLSILIHAMTFPKVKRLVYSTCSIHQIENESVVNRALDLTDNHFKLTTVMKDIPSRGQDLSETSSGFHAKKCLRMDPCNDLTNGFFVAMFEKVQHAKDSVKDVIERSGAKDIVSYISNDTHVMEKKQDPKLENQVNVQHCNRPYTLEKTATKQHHRKMKPERSKHQVSEQCTTEKTMPHVLGRQGLKARKNKKRNKKHIPVTA